MPDKNASSTEVTQILKQFKIIAVVGLSDKPDRPSYGVSAYMQAAGYRIIPVNPAAKGEILGEKVYASLKEIPEQVEIVDVFRKPEAVPEIVDDAIAIGAKVVWLQDGIVHNAAAEKARKAGLLVVQSKCLLREHRRMT
ncbi:MAG: CoA-binding protein [Planctomycetes bacterium]|nr:CoA-binding protein [Planctomycetota bacterium]